MDRPNIIFYFSDQQRWDTMGCYGQKLNVTPTLDRMANDGTRFEHAFTCQPVCGPARACLQTGKFASEVGCYANGKSLPKNHKHLADYFNEAGYETAYVGKWHLATDRGIEGGDFERTAIPVERRGGYRDYWKAADLLEFTSHGYNGYLFDENNNKLNFTGYRADCVNNFAIDYLKTRKTQKPFFLFVSQIEPHQQNDMDQFQGPDGSRKKFGSYDIPTDLQGKNGNYQQHYANYLGSCNRIDQNVARLLDTLEEQGIADDTIIFYTSDHGCHFHTRAGEYKRTCHEGSIRIPMIAYGPGFMGGHVVDDIVSLLDIPTTLLDCAGIRKPADFQGNSLKEILNHEVPQRKNEVYIQITEKYISRAIRTPEWTFSVRDDCGLGIVLESPRYRSDFLYNNLEDPGQNHNLVDDSRYNDIKQELAKKINQWQQTAHEVVSEIII